MPAEPQFCALISGNRRQKVNTNTVTVTHNLNDNSMAAQLHIPIYTSVTQLFADLGLTVDHVYVPAPH
jgi:hypothetical protein